MNDEIIEGVFYRQESQKTKNTSEIYIIEKIIRRNKNKYLVKWRNYSSDFNTWIDKNDIMKYTSHDIIKLFYVIFKYAIDKKYDIIHLFYVITIIL